MIIVSVKENEPIEKALKRFREKVKDSKLLENVKRKNHYTKPSILRRATLLSAIYKQKLQQEEQL